MGQPIQADLVSILVLCLRLDPQGLHAGVPLPGSDVLGVLLPKNPLRELPGLSLVSEAELLGLKDGILACKTGRR